MANWIYLGDKGLIASAQIIAVGQADSTPIRKLITALQGGKLLNLTYGQPRETILVLQGGWVVVSSLSLTEIMNQLEGESDAS